MQNLLYIKFQNLRKCITKNVQKEHQEDITQTNGISRYGSSAIVSNNNEKHVHRASIFFSSLNLYM